MNEAIEGPLGSVGRFAYRIARLAGLLCIVHTSSGASLSTVDRSKAIARASCSIGRAMIAARMANVDVVAAGKQ